MDAPHSLKTTRLMRPVPAAEAYRRLGPIARRFGRFEKGSALPETQVAACPRRRVADFPDGFLKAKWIAQQEQNQQIAHCCRHPERMTVAAFKSHADEGVPDIYIFYCDGRDEMGRQHHAEERRHIKWCVGETDDQRPEWS